MKSIEITESRNDGYDVYVRFDISGAYVTTNINQIVMRDDSETTLNLYKKMRNLDDNVINQFDNVKKRLHEELNLELNQISEAYVAMMKALILEKRQAMFQIIEQAVRDKNDTE